MDLLLKEQNEFFQQLLQQVEEEVVDMLLHLIVLMVNLEEVVQVHQVVEHQ
mgnify:CR=1 FL=1